MRLCYDSVTAADIPLDATMVAGYVDGPYRWSAADWTRFPHAVRVRIALFGATNDGHVLDVEAAGQWRPGQIADWTQRRRAAGQDPTVYMNLTTWPFVRADFRDRGLPEPHYWLALWDGSPLLAAGAVAKQYQGSAMTHHHYDLSVVADYWPGVDAPPSGPPAPAPDPCAPLRDQLASLTADGDRYRASVLQQLQFIEDAAQPLADSAGLLLSIDAARGLLG